MQLTATPAFPETGATASDPLAASIAFSPTAAAEARGFEAFLPAASDADSESVQLILPFAANGEVPSGTAPLLASLTNGRQREPGGLIPERLASETGNDAGSVVIAAGAVFPVEALPNPDEHVEATHDDVEAPAPLAGESGLAQSCVSVQSIPIATGQTQTVQERVGAEHRAAPASRPLPTHARAGIHSPGLDTTMRSVVTESRPGQQRAESSPAPRGLALGHAIAFGGVSAREFAPGLAHAHADPAAAGVALGHAKRHETPSGPDRGEVSVPFAPAEAAPPSTLQRPVTGNSFATPPLPREVALSTMASTAPLVVGTPSARSSAVAVLARSADVEQGIGPASASPLPIGGTSLPVNDAALSADVAVTAEMIPVVHRAHVAPRATQHRGGRMGAEKFAAPAERSATSIEGQSQPSNKTFLDTAGQAFVRRMNENGTGFAQPAPTMPEALLQPRIQVAPTLGAAEAGALSENAAATESAPMMAQRAVEAVLGAVERASASDRHAVHLDFSIGGAELKVHVVLRDAEVHATFLTDEPELRSALAQEWQAISGGAETERPWRFAAPVFGGADGASGFARSGDNAPRQDAQPQHRQPDVTLPVVSRRRSDPNIHSATAHRVSHASGAVLLETQA